MDEGFLEIRRIGLQSAPESRGLGAILRRGKSDARVIPLIELGAQAHAWVLSNEQRKSLHEPRYRCSGFDSQRGDPLREGV
jgi:hypothetical protein